MKKGAWGTAKERFWRKVDTTGDCWLWQGARTNEGYGRFWDGERILTAQRFAYELAIGAVHAGFNVLHHCDNPPCVRPIHLFLGTQADNLQDCAEKGRLNNSNRRKERCPQGHEYDSANTWYSKDGWRSCRRCSRDRMRRVRTKRAKELGL